MSTLPPIRSCSAGPAPRYGIWVMKVPVCCLNSSPARWCEVPALLEVGRRRLGVDHHHLRHVGQQCQRNEVFFDVVVELGVHRRCNGVVHRPHEQGVAVGRSLGGNAGAQRATGAPPVVDHQRLARAFGKLRGQRPGKGIGAATGGERHHHRHRLGRPVAVGPAAAAGQAPTCRRCAEQHIPALDSRISHSLSPVVVKIRCHWFTRHHAGRPVSRGKGCRCLPTLALCPAQASCDACRCASSRTGSSP